MWNSLTKPWRVCFEEAWKSYTNGSIPIGAVLVRHEDEIVFTGRNRTNESSAPESQVCGSRMAHAEINVLMQVKGSDSGALVNHSLYTTTEPCVLCFGAVIMSGVRSLRYAASDPVTGGTDLNRSTNTFIRKRDVDIQQGPKLLGNVQRVIRTVFALHICLQTRRRRFFRQKQSITPMRSP